MTDTNIDALTKRMGFWGKLGFWVLGLGVSGILYDSFNKEPPKYVVLVITEAPIVTSPVLKFHSPHAVAIRTCRHPSMGTGNS